MADIEQQPQEVELETDQKQGTIQLQKKGKKKRKTRSQRYKEKQPQVKPDERRGIVKDNENLIKFYKAQTFLEEGEFDIFLEGLRTTLPASFRINAFDYAQALFLRNLVKGPQFNEFLLRPSTDSPTDEQEKEERINGREEQGDDAPGEVQDNIAKSTTLVDRPPVLEPLGWYPQELAWQMNITRVDLKKSPTLQQLHQFIMAETDNGFISRQESVSMIPPLLLDVQTGQNILDMCAAPGSKTAQLLEYLKCDLFEPKSDRPLKTKPVDAFDQGLVVANDADNKRCYMLVHQASRLNSPNCVIINEDASRLPNIKIPDSTGSLVSLKFDRILCDVPCSGDGTVRKNPDVWRKWTVGNGNNFHGLQSKILRRGLELLEPNGLLVYSTCSMNPAENESVVAAALRASEGQVVLEDMSHRLKGLKYRPGVSKWIVMNRDMEVVESPADIKPDQASQVHTSLFPPTDEETKEFRLDRCIRMIPHLQNTGAFFVAVLKKLTPQLPWESDRTKQELLSENVDDDSKQKSQDNNRPKRRRYGGFKEDPFFFMNLSDPDCMAIKESYGIRDDFPFNQLMHRCSSGKKRSIYLVSKRTRDFIISNEEKPDKKESIKIINGGMRLFARAQTEAGFRICQDGVHEILPYVKEDLKVPINKNDLVCLLKSRAVPMDDLSSGAHLRDKIKPGSLILVYQHTNEQTDVPFDVPLVAWKGERCISLYVAKTYRIHLCALVQLKISEADLLTDNKQNQSTGLETSQNIVETQGEQDD